MEQQQNQTLEPRPQQYEEDTVFHVLEQYAEAVRNGDINVITSFFADNIRAFDMMEPLEFTTKATYQQAWEDYFINVFEFPVNFSYDSQKIEISGDMAFATSLVHVAGDNHHGLNIDTWLRNTTCLKKIHGQWLIIHEHTSVPLDDKTQKGIMNLVPEEGNKGQLL